MRTRNIHIFNTGTSVPLISPLLQVTTNMLYLFRFASGTSLNMKKHQCTPKTRACSSEEARFWSTFDVEYVKFKGKLTVERKGITMDRLICRYK